MRPSLNHPEFSVDGIQGEGANEGAKSVLDVGWPDSWRQAEKRNSPVLGRLEEKGIPEVDIRGHKTAFFFAAEIDERVV